MRYALAGGKRIRAVICLADGRGRRRRAGEPRCRPRPRSSSCTRSRSSTTTCRRSTTTTSAAAGRARTSRSGRASALLAGDALLVEAFRFALAYPTPEIARELAEATLGMIGGQYLDITGADDDLDELHRLKTGRLFAASVGLGIRVARRAGGRAGAVARLRRGARTAVPGRRRHPRRRRLREPGSAWTAARDVADATAERATAALDAIPADTPCWPRSSRASSPAPPDPSSGGRSARRPRARARTSC